MANLDVTLSPFQADFLKRAEEPLVILQTGIGAGKSRALAWWLIMRATKGERILAIAQTFRALNFVLFREVIQICILCKIPFSQNKTEKVIKIGEGEIYGASGDNPEGILGFTDFTSLAIDEAGYIPEECYNNAADRLRGEKVATPLIRLTSSPSGSSVTSWFSRVCLDNPECVIRASSLDNAFTSRKFKTDLMKRYGVGTALYRQQVLGEIINTDFEDTMFSFSLLDAAKTRDRQTFGDDAAIIGLDCARFGDDKTVGVLRIGRAVVRIEREGMTDTESGVELVKRLVNECKARNVRLDCICVDAAQGGGIIDMLRKQDYTVFEVNFASKTNDAQYYNQRAYMYGRAREWLEQGGYFDDADLVGDLFAQRYFVHADKSLRLFPKELIKKKLGHSPDTSDAFALTFYEQAVSNGLFKKGRFMSPRDAKRNQTNIIRRSTHRFSF